MHDLQKIPAMTPPVLHDYLREIGSQWTGQGVAMELGCYFGASSIALLQGLVSAGYNMPYYAYDRWEANIQQVQIAQRSGIHLALNQDVRPYFKDNVNKVYDNVIATKGNMPKILDKYPNTPIEICLFDAPKKNPIFKECMNRLLPYCIPEVTVFGLLDYFFYRERSGEVRDELLAPVLFMYQYRANFIQIKEFPGSTCAAFFKYVKKI